MAKKLIDWNQSRLDLEWKKANTGYDPDAAFHARNELADERAISRQTT